MPSERVQRQIDRLLTEAETALADGQWDVVRKRADAVLRLDPGNRDATAYLDAAGRPSSLEAPASASDADKPASAVSAAAPEPTHARETPPVPTSFASGRYAVKEFLGEGGKKKVYLAHDTTLDRDVAFALIKSESLDEAARRRILREAQAMGRLGDHPNIVPIHDLGTDNGQPFMVLPLMQGGDVAGMIETAKDRRPPLDQVLRVARDVCEGLVFAHSKGIVHRDLKPGNVWLTERDQAKIGDFGLALPLDQSRLTREGFMVGTVAYMPPEQAMGGEITPRADLYSLGCMLYEMVTGRPPFLGDDDIAIIGQHISTPPVAPSWHNPQCPKPLDALIMRLLSKDPKQRPDSAEDVLSALEAVDVSLAAPPPEKPPDWKEGQGRSLDSMSSGVFVGRQKEMDQLRAALEEALSGRGRMVTLVGEPGIGKTRTAQELQTYAGLRRCQVLWGRCYEGGGAPPYWPWVQALRSYIRERSPEDLRREMGSTASVIAEVVADVKERLPGLQPPPVVESPESARFRLFDSITAFLKSASTSRPIVLVLDDLHWSDKPSLLLLEFIARELANSRLLVVGTYRDVEINRKHPLSQTIGELTKERLFDRVLLRGVQKHDVERFIEVATGVKPPPGLVDAVHTQTEGNPLFVTEVVRWLVQEGALTREKVSDKKSWSMPIPEGVRDVIGKRLDRLSPRCNDVLTTASVIGRRFALSALVHLYADESLPLEERVTENGLLEVLEEVLGARVIEELPTGPGRYQFTHALIQETLAKELSTTRKVRLHARIGLVLEELYKDRLEERAAELAEHFAESETVLGKEKLVKYSLLAGQRALVGLAYEDALQHFTRGLVALRVPLSGRDPATDETSAALLDGVGQALSALKGRQERQAAIDTLGRAIDFYIQAGDLPKAIAAAGFFGPAVGGYTDIASVTERIIQKLLPNSPFSARMLAIHANAIGHERGEWEAAHEMCRTSLEKARAAGDLPTEALALKMSMALALNSIQIPLWTERARRLVVVSARVGDLHSMVWAEGAAASLAVDGCRNEEGRSRIRRTLELAEHSRNPNLMENAVQYVSHLLFRLGEWEEYRKALSLGMNASPGFALFVGAAAYLDFLSGEYVQGRAKVEQLVERMRAEPPTAQWAYLVPAGVILAAARATGQAGDIPTARYAIEAILAAPRPYPGVRWISHASLAAIAAMNGDRADARRHFDALNAIAKPPPLWGGYIPMTHMYALAAAGAGRADIAASQFEEALDYARQRGLKTDIALLGVDYAEFLLGDVEPGKAPDSEPTRTRTGQSDRDQAVNLQEEALSFARELGMKPLIERILRRREILRA